VIQADEVLSRLDHVRPTGRGWLAKCPAHTDKSPSLSIARGLDGRALLRCFAGCRYDEIIHALDIETDTPSVSTRASRSTFAIALEMARRQPWYREETRLMYRIADAIRRCRRAVMVARAIAGRAGDRPQTWHLLATAADVERAAERIEGELEEILG